MKSSVKITLALVIVLSAYFLVVQPHISQAQPLGAGSAAIAAPALVSPANGEQIAYDAQPFVFNWDEVGGAIGYRLQVSRNSNYSSLVYNVTPTSDGWAAQTPFAAGTYYWRVRARTAKQEGRWSETRRVVVQAAPMSTPVPASGGYQTTRPYASTSIWNTPIGANPALDPYSSQMVGTLGQSSTGGRIYSDTTRYTYPVYFADASTPRYNVPCLRYKCTVVDANGAVSRVTTMTNVPIPAGAQVASGADAQMIVVDTTSGMEYGFYHGRWANGGYEVDNGYTYNVTWNGTPVPFGSRGAGVTYYAGLIRPWEIRAGQINHAIAFAYDSPVATRCVYPATQTDGPSSNPYALPEGARLQLNPALTEANFDAWGLSRAGRIVARALQQYGMILIDTGGSPKIMAEDLVDNPLTVERWTDPDLLYDKNVIANIPYSEFRVLALPAAYWSGAYSPNYGKCIR